MPVDAKRLRELLEKATQGKRVNVGPEIYSSKVMGRIAKFDERYEDDCRITNAVLSCKAVNALPALLDELEKMLAVVEAAKGLSRYETFAFVGESGSKSVSSTRCTCCGQGENDHTDWCRVAAFETALAKLEADDAD